jgi:hypothetical protein
LNLFDEASEYHLDLRFKGAAWFNMESPQTAAAIFFTIRV